MERNGVFFPGAIVSAIERDLFLRFTAILESNQFHYLSIPSTVTRETIERQGVVSWEKVIKLSDTTCLSGSAEQGILEKFTDQEILGAEWRVYAENQCFRNETTYVGLKYLREFRKLEQFVFCGPDNWEPGFQLVLNLAKQLLEENEITYREVDVTTRDPGYHIKKVDLEVLTKTYGWLETHSCTYFGDEQTRRFGIRGLTHTISNTGVASPRILVPILEREGLL